MILFVLAHLSTFLQVLVALAVEKAFLEPVARQLGRRFADRLIRQLPRVYDALDDRWPDLEARLSPDGLEAMVRSAFEQLTGEDWSRASIRRQDQAVEEFFLRRDSRIAAKKRIHATCHD